MKTEIVSHCTDTPPGMYVDAEMIRGWHLDRGWSDIGYAYVVLRDGTVELGRDLDGDGDVTDEVGAHVLGHNETSIGIVYVGGRGENGQPQFNATPDQMFKLECLVAELEQKFPGINVFGHCDFTDEKACPVFDVRAWRETFA